jgi:hypothetical protein
VIVAPLLIRGQKMRHLAMKTSQREQNHGGTFCLGFKKVVPCLKGRKIYGASLNLV